MLIELDEQEREALESVGSVVDAIEPRIAIYVSTLILAALIDEFTADKQRQAEITRLVKAAIDDILLVRN